MGFSIKRKGPADAVTHTEDRYEDALHVAHGLMKEGVQKSRTTITNLKTGETLNEAEIEEAVLSVGPRKRRTNAG